MSIVSFIRDLFKKNNKSKDGACMYSTTSALKEIPTTINRLDEASYTFLTRLAKIDKAFEEIQNAGVCETTRYCSEQGTLVQRAPSTKILSLSQQKELCVLEQLKELEEMKRKKSKESTCLNFPKNRPEWFVNKDYEYNPSPAEKLIIKELSLYTVPYYTEVSFKGLVSDKGGLLRFDFWIPSLNTLIEYDGKKSHNSERVKQRDTIKTAYCKYHKINLIRLNSKHYYHIPECVKKIITSTFS